MSLSLKERLALRAKESQQQEPTEKNERTESTQDALKIPVNTNIKELTENAPKIDSVALAGIYGDKKLSFAEKLALKRANIQEPIDLQTESSLDRANISPENAEGDEKHPLSSNEANSAIPNVTSKKADVIFVESDNGNLVTLDKEIFEAPTPYDFKDSTDKLQNAGVFKAIETVLANERKEIEKKSITQILQEKVYSEQKKLSLAEKIALREQLDKDIADEIAQSPQGNINLPILQKEPSSALKIDNSRLVEPIKDKIAKSLLERLAEKKASQESTVNHQTEIVLHDGKAEAPVYTDSHTFNLSIQLNKEQLAAVELARNNRSGVLIGGAGTGKTTSEREIMKAILDSPTIKTSSFKIAGDSRIDAPSVAVVGYTRRAAANSAKAILKDPILKEMLPHNIMTIHALLEFIPDTYFDEEDNERFRFAPTKTASNPLTLTHLIIEEATLVGLDLWQQLLDALPKDCKIIFVGDINQLPPVFGASILNYALTRLPVIELKHIYRQEAGSPIIENAHRILSGQSLLPETNKSGKLTIIEGKNAMYQGQAKTAGALSNMFKTLYESNIYNPEEDMILSPWNKRDLGTTALNTIITEFLSIKNNTVVYEIIAGFAKLYLAIGDKVMYNKQDCVIVDIVHNPAYIGKAPQLEGADLSRWGFRRLGQGNHVDLDEEAIEGLDYSEFDIDALSKEDAERKMQASHQITVAFESGYTMTLKNAGDFSPSVFSLGYALTVHKSQGSEWRKVFIVFHKDHAISLSREMLYTAITRAREEVYLFAKSFLLDATIQRQKVKGNTLTDKIEYFNSGIEKQLDINFIRV